MNRVRTLRFEPLEGRELLSVAHHARAAHAARSRHAAPAAVGSAPLAFDGTLKVNNGAATMSPNLAGGYTTSAPVSGSLGAVGKVRGVWSESSDSFGDYLGPDTLTLRGAQGSFTVQFSNASSGPAHKDGRTVYYVHDQRAKGSSGAYVNATENGTIDLNMNASHTTVVSMTLTGS